MVVEFPLGEGSGSEIKCPDCGCMFMHQLKAEVFRRNGEDNSEGIQMQVGKYNNGDKPFSFKCDSMDRNPSRSRDGIRIYFECEQGCENSLCIAQHKGTEEVYWEQEDGDVDELAPENVEYESWQQIS